MGAARRRASDRALCHHARVRRLATTWAETIRIISLTIERLLRR